MRQKQKTEFIYRIFLFFFSLLISYVITILGILGLALLLLFFQISMEMTDKIIYGIYWGAVLGGIFFLKKISPSGFQFRGIVFGICYSFLFFIVSKFSNTEFQIWQKEHGFLLLNTVLAGGIGDLVADSFHHTLTMLYYKKS